VHPWGGCQRLREMARRTTSSPLVLFVGGLIVIQLLGWIAPTTVASATTQTGIIIALELVVLLLAVAEDNNALALLIGFFLLLNLVGLASDLSVGVTSHLRPSSGNTSSKPARTEVEKRAELRRHATAEAGFPVNSFYGRLESYYSSRRLGAGTAAAANVCEAITRPARLEVARAFLSRSQWSLPTACELALKRTSLGVFGRAPSFSQLERRVSVANNLTDAEYVADNGVRLDLEERFSGGRHEWLLTNFEGGPFPR
jgi:hypothetical protein